MRDKILLCGLVYLVVFLFSYNYYQSDIDKYQEIMLNQEKYKHEYALSKELEGVFGKPQNSSSELFDPALAKRYWDDAKDKRSSLMINSFAATTIVLIGAYFYWSKRKGRNDS